jgi:hypothetical protein
MNCHPLIILIILNFKREPTSKSSLRNRQLRTKLSLEHPLLEREYSIGKPPSLFQIKKTVDIHSIMRS